MIVEDNNNVYKTPEGILDLFAIAKDNDNVPMTAGDVHYFATIMGDYNMSVIKEDGGDV